MEFGVRGDLDGGPGLALDHEAFSYAGKFRMTGTGKAVATDEGAVVGVAAFNRDRADPDRAWIRYVSVRRDRRGSGIGARLLAFAAAHLLDSVDRVRIAVNNPFAYVAAYKAGFGFTGERTGLAELVLSTDGDRSRAGFERGLEAFRARDDLSAAERRYLDGDRPLPDPVAPPD